MAAAGQPRSQLFHQSLKAAVVGGHAARTQDGDFHRRRFCREAGGTKAKPARQLPVGHAPLSLHLPALGANAPALPPEEAEGRQRSPLPRQHVEYDSQIAQGGGEKRAPENRPADILGAQEEAVLGGVIVEHRRQGAAVFGQDAPQVVADCFGDVEAFPARELRAPSQVGVFAVGKEVGVKELAVH